jgi:hypothetical protein
MYRVKKLLSLSRWRQYHLLKPESISTKLYGITSPTFVFFIAIALRTANLTINSNFSQGVQEDLILEDGTDRLSRNVRTELPLNAAEYPRRAQISGNSLHQIIWFSSVTPEKFYV